MEFIVLALLTGHIFLVAAIGQAVTGFGFAIVAVPLLAVTMEPRSAVVAATLVGLLLGVGATCSERAHARWDVVRRLGVVALLGLPAGVLILTVVDDALLEALIAVVALSTVAFLGLDARIPTGRAATTAAGFLSGVLQTSTGMGGPPLVLALHSRNLIPSEFRVTLMAISVTQTAVAGTVFIIMGYIDGIVVLAVVAGAIGAPIGWWIGDRLFGLIAPHRFRHVVLAGMSVAALSALWSALRGA